MRVSWETPPTVMPPPRDALAEAAERHGVRRPEIRGRSRVARIVKARDEAALLMHQRGLSYPQIGARLGGRDHSTIIAAVRRAKARLAVEEET